LNSIKFIMNKNLYTNIIGVTVMDERYRFILFIQPKELVTVDQDETDIKIYYDETISFLKGTIEVIQAVCRESVNASISFALSGQPCCWEDVTEKYLFLS